MIKNIITKIILLYIIVIEIQMQTSKTRYRLVTLSQENGARCTDGTPPTIYVKQNSKTHFMFLLRGGGWARSDSVEGVIKSFYDRRYKGDRGSSKDVKDNFEGKYFMSTDPQINPYFYDYTVIYMNYCDSAGHQGHTNEPFSYKGESMWNRGEANTKEAFKYALDELQINKAQKVVVGGFSAGGQGAFSWINYIGDELKKRNNNIKIFGYSDAGVFLDLKDIYQDKRVYANRFKNLAKIANKDADPIVSECVKDLGNEKYKCVFAQYLIKYIKYPTLFIQSQYDRSAAGNVLRSNCQQKDFQRCPDIVKEEIQDYRKELVNFFEKEVQPRPQGHGVWSIACICHTMGRDSFFNDYKWTIPAGSGFTLEQAAHQFINLEQPVWKIDGQQWPDGNPGCAYDFSRTTDMFDLINEETSWIIPLVIVLGLVIIVFLYLMQKQFNQNIKNKYIKAL